MSSHARALRRLAERRKCIFKVFRFSAVCLLSLVARYYIKEARRFYVRHNVDAANMPEEKLEFFFRWKTYGDFVELLEALDLGPFVTCDNGTKVTSEHALLVVLRRLAFPNRLGDIMDLLGRDRSQLSRIFNRTIDRIYEKKGYLLETLDWVPAAKIREYAAAVHRASKRYGQCVVISSRVFPRDSRVFPRTNTCWGFLDGTARAICKPGLFQQEYYSGHAGHHVMKFQSLVTPDGLILNMFGPVEGRRHDMFVLMESDLIAVIQQKHRDWETPEFCIYADKGYSLCDEIQVPYQGLFLTEDQIKFNKDMSTCRTAVEFGFLKITQYFAAGNYWQNQRPFYQQIAKTYLISALLANCHTCAYGFDLVKTKFALGPPSLKTYLSSKRLLH